MAVLGSRSGKSSRVLTPGVAALGRGSRRPRSSRAGWGCLGRITCRSFSPSLFSSPLPDLPKCTFCPYQSDFLPEGRQPVPKVAKAEKSPQRRLRRGRPRHPMERVANPVGNQSRPPALMPRPLPCFLPAPASCRPTPCCIPTHRGAPRDSPAAETGAGAGEDSTSAPWRRAAGRVTASAGSLICAERRESGRGVSNFLPLLAKATSVKSVLGLVAAGQREECVAEAECQRLTSPDRRCRSRGNRGEAHAR